MADNDPDRTAPLDDDDLDRLLAMASAEMLDYVQRRVSDRDIKEKLEQILRRAPAAKAREPDPAIGNPGDAAEDARGGGGQEPLDFIARYAKPLLGLLACLADAEIPLFLFDTSVIAGSALSAELDPEVLPELLDALAEFHLIEMAEAALPGPGDDASARPLPVLRLCPAVRDTSRRRPDFAARHSAYLTLAAVMLHRAAESDPEHPRNWPRWQLLAPHCGFLLHSITEGLVPDLPANTVDQVASAAQEAARYLYARGFLEEAEAEFQAILEIRQQLTSDNTAAILTARDWRACVLRDRGHLAAAERELRAVYEARRELLGRTPDATGLLARLACIDWQTPEGLVLLDRSWDVSSARTLLDMVDSYGALATTLAYRAGSSENNPDKCEAGARRAHLATYQARLRVLGDHHKDTLATRCNVAIRVYNEGLLAGSHDLLEQAELEFRTIHGIECQLPELGDRHPDTLTTLTWLGAVLQALDRLDESEAAYREAHRLCGQVLGYRHPQTLWAHRGLADVLYDRGEQAAEAEEQAVIAAWRHLVDAESLTPHEGLPTLSNREGLAWALVGRGRRLLQAAVSGYQGQPSQGKDARGTVVPSSGTKQGTASIDYPTIEAVLGDPAGSSRSRTVAIAFSAPDLSYPRLPGLAGSAETALASCQLTP